MANFTNSCQIPRKWIHVGCKNVCHLFMWNCMFHGSRVIAKFPHCSVLGDCFLIHKSELRLDVVSVKALCSTVINPKFLLRDVWLHLCVSCIGSKWFCPSCISQFWSFRNKVWNSRYLFPHWFTRRFTCEFLSPFWQFRQRVSLCSFIVLIFSGFRFLLVLATSFLVLPHSYSLLGVAGCSVGVMVSCDEDVGEVGEDEVEELVDRQGTTNGTSFSV